MDALPARCRELVRMLFFEEPAREYREIAKSLGIAVGSIGFIRQRCLEKLRKRLAEAGFS
jgi:DNA-directed RNA polymerase specialized sigma24 family protein